MILASLFGKVALVAFALLVLLVGGSFVYFFVYYTRMRLGHYKWKKGILGSERYKALRDKYLSEGHKPSKAHDLAMRRLHRKASRSATQAQYLRGARR